MLKIQEFLQTHKPEEAYELFGIGMKRHPEFPNLVMFKYSQIAAPMGERIVQECRGIILDEANAWTVVSRPYDKFFNVGEGHAAPIDWASARVYEKVDGSLCTLYHYRGEWRVASSGMPDAGGPVNAGTFAELFWRVWKYLGYMMPSDPGLCLMFELMTPHNRVVVPHTTERIVLHGARNIFTGQEVTPENAREASYDGWEIIKTYPLATVADCLAAAETLRPMECEGYVVCDKHFNRVKIKSPAYVALAHAKEGFNGRAIIELVRKNEGEEFLSYFPELRTDYQRIKLLFAELLAEVEIAYASIRDIPLQKDFAAAALTFPHPAILFAMRNKKMTAEAFMRNATIYGVEKMLGVASPVAEVAG